MPEAIRDSAAVGSGVYTATSSRGATITRERPGALSSGGVVGPRRGGRPGAARRTRRRAVSSRRSPTASAGRPPGATSHGSTRPPSRTSISPTPAPDSRPASTAPTRPAPRTPTRRARRAARCLIASPGSEVVRDSEARSGRSRSRTSFFARSASAAGPPPRESSSRPASARRSTTRSTCPSGRSMRCPASRSSAGPRVPLSSSRKLPVAVSTGARVSACAGVMPNCTVFRSRQPRLSAGFTIGCMPGPPYVSRCPCAGPPSAANPPASASMPGCAERRRKLSTGGGYSSYESAARLPGRVVDRHRCVPEPGLPRVQRVTSWRVRRPTAPRRGTPAHTDESSAERPGDEPDRGAQKRPATPDGLRVPGG